MGMFFGGVGVSLKNSEKCLRFWKSPDPVRGRGSVRCPAVSHGQVHKTILYVCVLKSPQKLWRLFICECVRSLYQCLIIAQYHASKLRTTSRLECGLQDSSDSSTSVTPWFCRAAPCAQMELVSSLLPAGDR